MEILTNLNVQRLLRNDPNKNTAKEQDQIWSHVYQVKQQIPLAIVQPKNKSQWEISKTGFCKSIPKEKNYQKKQRQ